MFAIAFDLVVKDTTTHNPKGVAASYAEIGAVLAKYSFRRVQGSLYVSENEDLANLMDAVDSLSDLHWFPFSVRDIRAFRIEQWSDLTKRVTRKKTNL